jgi:hypothetical protein
MSPTDLAMRDIQAQRRAARRTAWILGAVALAVFAAFIASGMMGR